MSREPSCLTAMGHCWSIPDSTRHQECLFCGARRPASAIAPEPWHAPSPRERWGEGGEDLIALAEDFTAKGHHDCAAEVRKLIHPPSPGSEGAD